MLVPGKSLHLTVKHLKEVVDAGHSGEVELASLHGSFIIYGPNHEYLHADVPISPFWA